MCVNAHPSQHGRRLIRLQSEHDQGGRLARESTRQLFSNR
jgi:hypothetical protein